MNTVSIIFSFITGWLLADVAMRGMGMETLLMKAGLVDIQTVLTVLAFFFGWFTVDLIRVLFKK